MPAATRIGHADVAHCSGMTRAEGSDSVFINGIKWSCEGDINTGHLKPQPPPPPCIVHTAPIASGSSTVKIGGDGAGRIGDGITGCTSVAEGSENVFAGP